MTLRDALGLPLLFVLTGCAPAAVASAAPAAADAAVADVAAADAPPSDAVVLTIESPPRCCDIPGGSMTVREDGRVDRRSCGGFSGGCTDASFVLANGAADVAALRRGIEASGLLDVPPGVYPAGATLPNVITYHRAGRSDTWSIDPRGSDVPPGYTAAMEAIFAVLFPDARP